MTVDQTDPADTVCDLLARCVGFPTAPQPRSGCRSRAVGNAATPRWHAESTSVPSGDSGGRVRDGYRSPAVTGTAGTPAGSWSDPVAAAPCWSGGDEVSAGGRWAGRRGSW